MRKVDMQQGDRLPRKVRMALLDKTTEVWAHNAQFERICFSVHLKGWGNWIDPTGWRDTAVYGATLGLPRKLDEMATALGAADKDKEGKRLIQYFSKPCKPTKVNGGRTQNLPEHAPDDWHLYGEYNKQDVVAERSIHETLCEIHTMPEREWKRYETDQRIADRGILVDRTFIARAITLRDKLRKRAKRKLQRHTGIEDVTIHKLKAWAAESGFPLASLDANHKEDYLADKRLRKKHPAVYKMIKLYDEMGGNAVAKYDTMALRVCRDSRLHGELIFYGAGATGRWAGNGVQVQNLPRIYVKPDVLDKARNAVLDLDVAALRRLGDPFSLITQLVRTAIIAPEDKKLAVSDYAQIEARVLPWYAGEGWALQAFKDGQDIYRATAVQMYHIPYEDSGGSYRQRGKQATLALGYNGAAGALIAMGALRQGIPEQELPKLVKTWRNANPNIVRFWQQCDQAAKAVIKYMGRKKVAICDGRLVFRYNAKHKVMLIRLPSGRSLCYFDCDVRHGRVTYFKGLKNARDKDDKLIKDEQGNNKKEPFHVDTFGGKLVENIVQATARDLLAEALDRMDAAGLETVFHVHDESITEVPADYDIEKINSWMVEPAPEWSAGLPIASEGATIDYYRKV